MICIQFYHVFILEQYQNTNRNRLYNKKEMSNEKHDRYNQHQVISNWNMPQQYDANEIDSITNAIQDNGYNQIIEHETIDYQIQDIKQKISLRRLQVNEYQLRIQAEKAKRQLINQLFQQYTNGINQNTHFQNNQQQSQSYRLRNRVEITNQKHQRSSQLLSASSSDSVYQQYDMIQQYMDYMGKQTQQQISSRQDNINYIHNNRIQKQYEIWHRNKTSITYPNKLTKQKQRVHQVQLHNKKNENSHKQQYQNKTMKIKRKNTIFRAKQNHSINMQFNKQRNHKYIQPQLYSNIIGKQQNKSEFDKCKDQLFQKYDRIKQKGNSNNHLIQLHEKTKQQILSDCPSPINHDRCNDILSRTAIQYRQMLKNAKRQQKRCYKLTKSLRQIQAYELMFSQYT